MKSAFSCSQTKGIESRPSMPLQVKFRNVVVGEFYADILVETKIILELKTSAALSRENFAQVINYLKATGIEVGLLVNFGNPKLEYRRFNNKFIETQNIRDVLINRDRQDLQG